MYRYLIYSMPIAQILSCKYSILSQHAATMEGLLRRTNHQERAFVLTRAFFAGSQRTGRRHSFAKRETSYSDCSNHFGLFL